MITANPKAAALFYFQALYEFGKEVLLTTDKKQLELNDKYWDLHGKEISKMKAIKTYSDRLDNTILIAMTEYNHELLNRI